MENQNRGKIIPQYRIPIIIAAIVQRELPLLEHNIASNTDIEELYNFMKLLEASGIGAVPQRYGDKRKDWRPFNGETVEGLIRGLFTRLENVYSFEPDFDLTKDFFDVNRITRENTWAAIRNRCFLIIDGVSMYHPRIRDCIVGALGMLGKQATVAVLSPLDVTRQQIHEKLLGLIQRDFQAVMARYRASVIGRDFDPGADVLAGDSTCFYRWLRIHMERINNELGRMQPGRRDFMQNISPTVSPDFTP